MRAWPGAPRRRSGAGGPRRRERRESAEAERLLDEAQAAGPWPPSTDATFLLAVLRVALGGSPSSPFGPVVRGQPTRCDQTRAAGRVLRWLGLVPDRELAGRAADELLAALPDAVAWSPLHGAGRQAAPSAKAVLGLVERLGGSWTDATRPDPFAVHEVVTSAGLEPEVFAQARASLRVRLPFSQAVTSLFTV